MRRTEETRGLQPWLQTPVVVKNHEYPTTAGRIPLCRSGAAYAALKGYGTVIVAAPDTFDTVALISTLPLAMLVTTPVDETVATEGLDEVQFAVLLTSSMAPLESVARAENLDVEPTGGTVPVTEIDNTEVDAVGELPHAAADRPRIRIKLEKRTDRNDT